MASVRVRRTFTACARRPSLWGIALVEWRRMTPAGWWRRRPFLPVPDRDLMRFRMQTQYGDPDHPPEPDDLVTWLQWCKRMRALER
jgi:hypothetical protein